MHCDFLHDRMEAIRADGSGLIECCAINDYEWGLVA